MALIMTQNIYSRTKAFALTWRTACCFISQSVALENGLVGLSARFCQNQILEYMLLNAKSKRK